MSEGVVFNIQRYCINDGPGIRTTVFLKGCPLHCWWCHNPESQSPRPQIAYMESRCIRCGECIAVCPQTTEKPTSFAPPFERCERCSECVEVCPSGARQMLGRVMDSAEVLAEIIKDRPFYETSGGGATFSGGEPLMQQDFLMSLLEACQSAGISTAVDTSGFAPWERLERASPLTDLFLYDLKLVDSEEHQRHTGVPSRPILENLSRLATIHSQIWIRVPIIPGFNDTPEAIAAIGSFVRPLAAVRRVNLLPYHPLGTDKQRRIGYALAHQEPATPSREEMEKLARILRDSGITAMIGG